MPVNIRILSLSRYVRRGASSRIRFFQFADYLNNSGFTIVESPLLDDDYLSAIYQNRRPSKFRILRDMALRFMKMKRTPADVLWIEKEVFPYLPYLFDSYAIGAIPFVVDFDDAVFHNYEQHSNPMIRKFLGNKYNKIIRDASIVTVGNDYIAEYAKKAGARDIRVIPSVVDTGKYQAGKPPKDDHALVIGWIGTPATQNYVLRIRQVLDRLLSSGNIRLHLIGASDIGWEHSGLKIIPWAESTEIQLIREFDVGIMPLPDEPFERGKCGYKLIQCMACGKPVIASPVGANKVIVRSGINGFLADTDEEWESAFAALLSDVNLRETMGMEGRKAVESSYSLMAIAPIMANAMRDSLVKNQKFQP